MYYNLQKLSTIQKLPNIISTFFKYCDKNEYGDTRLVLYNNRDLNNDILGKIDKLIANAENFVFNDIQKNKKINNVINYNDLKTFFGFSNRLNLHNNTFYCIIEIMNKFFRDCTINEVLELDYQENSSMFKDSLNYFYENSEEQINIHNIGDIFNNNDDIFNLSHFIKISRCRHNFYNIVLINAEPIVFSNNDYDITEVLLIYIILSLNVIKEDGNCIVKLDLKYISTTIYLEIFFFLSSIFQSVVLCKPSCSILNEHTYYIICKNKNVFNKDEIIDVTIPVFQNIVEKPKHKYTYSFLKYDIPLFYKNKFVETFINFQRYDIEVFDHMCNLLLSPKQPDRILTQVTKQTARLQQWIDENTNHNGSNGSNGSNSFCKSIT